MTNRIFNYKIKTSDLIGNINIGDYKGKSFQVLRTSRRTGNEEVQLQFNSFDSVIETSNPGDDVVVLYDDTGELHGCICSRDTKLAFDDIAPRRGSPRSPSHSPPHSPPHSRSPRSRSPSRSPPTMRRQARGKRKSKKQTHKKN